MPQPSRPHARVRSARLCLSLTAACLMLTALSLSQTFIPSSRVEARRSSRPAGVESAPRRLSEAYGKLPLRFEANRGQTGGAAQFLARGSGYTLFLSKADAVLRLRGAETTKGSPRTAATLRFRLEGANRSAKAVGLDELPGRSNYLVGRDARRWLTGVPAFARVRYESVYPGVDVVYYGSEGRLEYDFVVAPGASPARIRLGLDGARSVSVDEGGDLVIKTDGGEVRQQRPVAFQEVGGERREVSARYEINARGTVRLKLGDYDRTRRLVIDPVLIYSSYLGGLGTDQGLAVAVDSAGSAYVAGSTQSADFPTQSPFQGSNAAFTDAFVLKLAPDGKSLVYATYLGGNGDDIGNGIAVDAGGNAYVVGLTGSGSFPVTPGAFQDRKEGGLDAFAAKLNSAGTALVYATYLGGGGSEQAFAVALDSAGAAYVAGRTDSLNFTRFPVAARAGHPAQRSTDGGGTWAASDSGLDASAVNDFAVAPGIVYAGANLGVYRSTDGGSSWQLTGQSRTSTAPLNTRAVVVDPSNPAVVYAGTLGNGKVYKSTDGGLLYDAKGNGITNTFVQALAIDPTSPSTLYAGTALGIFKTTDGGENWAEVRGGITGTSPSVNRIVLDPSNAQTVYAATNRGVLKSTDGGANWIAINNGITIGSFTPSARTIALDPSNPSTLYASTGAPIVGVFKSTNGGASWTNSSNGLNGTFGGATFAVGVNALLVDPSTPSTVYAGTALFGVFKSTDGGANWAAGNAGLTSKNIQTLAPRPGSPAALLAGANVGADAFVAKLDPAGTHLAYMRMLGGSENDEARGVAVGSDGSAYVTGTTFSDDLAAAGSFQPAIRGTSDAFAVKLDPSGATAFTTYLGGTSSEQGADVAVGSDGSAYVTGTTSSADFPTANALQPAIGNTPGVSDAFVTKLAPDGHSLAYSTYLGGSSGEVGFGIAAGSDGSAYVTGLTASPDFPVLNPSNARGGGNDAFVTRINPAGSALLFSTYFGGGPVFANPGNDQGNRVAVDAAGGIYVVGTTGSTNLPVVNAARDAFAGGSSDAFVAKFGPGVDLSVSMTDSPDPVAFGSDLTYSIKVKNNAELQATGVRLTDTLPAGAALVSAVTNHGTCSGTSTVICELGSLNGGEEATVTIKVKPPASRTINNTAAVTLNETDAVPGNNSASAETSVEFADIAVAKSVLSGTAAPGSKVIYTLTLTNRAGVATSPVTLTDNLPPEVTFLSCGSEQGVCGGTGNTRSVSFPTMAEGATFNAVIVATTNQSVAAGTVVNNTASASSATPDPDQSNNTASAAFTVGPTNIAAKSNGKIAFTTFEAPTTRINVVGADGTGLTAFTPGQDSDRKAAWSPDGSKLAYRTTTHTGSAPEPENVVVVNADGTGKVTVATNANVNSNVTWSPSGGHLAFVGRDFSVYVVRPDGTGLARLVNNSAIISGLAWSPDGSRFAFTKDNTLWVMDLDGSNQHQLTTQQQTQHGLSFDSDPDWSPDGSKVLFTRSAEEGRDAYVVRADGTGLARLLNVMQMGFAAWSPDGMKVVYTIASDIYVANLDGSGLPSKIARAGLDPAWQPLPNPNPTPTPTPAETFTISGRVTKPSGVAGSAIVELSGARRATTATDSQGNYTFINLPRGGSYTVTPTVGFSTDFTTYAPGSRTVTDLQADVTGLDFVEQSTTHTLRGRVVDAQGQPMPGVTVSLFTGFGARRDTTTDVDGRYSFTLFTGGEGFRVMAIFQPYSFDPVSAFPVTITGDLTVNFVGTPFANARGISGRVVDAAGESVAGLRVTLSGARSAVVKTDTFGNYGFVNLPTGQTYTVTPSTAEGFTFAPPQRTFENLTFDTGGGFNATTTQPVAQFAAADVTVAENARAVELTVVRAGDNTAAASVDYETSELTASERSDYLATYGTVRFAKGEASKTFKILVTDDNLVEGERLFRVTLTRGSGVRVGAANTATVHITEDDATASASNPLDSSEFFVRQHYADFLNREPDAPGLGFWTNEIEQCGSNQQCREVKRINVSAAFFLSIEFKETGFLVYRLHRAAYGTGEALRLKTFLKDTQELGRGVVVGQGDWQNQLEANKRAFAEDFVLRPEFLMPYPATLPPAHFVDALNANTGGSLSQGERDALVSALAAGTKTRGEVLRAVAENAEFTRRETNRAFVLMQYFGYLRRSPAEPPDSDFVGYNFWLAKLNQFNGNFVQAEMVKAFLESIEYRRRFGR